MMGRSYLFYSLTRRSRYRPAFTIVELLVVIVIIGILAAITLVSYSGITTRATVSSLQSDLTNAVTQLKLDQVINSSFPTTLALANGGKGIPSSPSTNYTYAINNNTNPQTFCITATKNNMSYNITQDGTPLFGVCPILHFDAGNISSYPGTGTTLTDLSGNGNNGTLLNGVGYSSANGGAFTFDGVNDTIGTTFGIPAGRSFTIDVVGKVNDTSISNNFISANPPVFIRVVGGKVKWNIYIKKDSDSTYAWSFNLGNINILPNVIYDLTMTYDGTSLKGYVNGVQDINISFAGQIMASSSMVVGYTTGGEDSPLLGSVYSVSVYNTTTSASDIQQNFSNIRGRYGI